MPSPEDRLLSAVLYLVARRAGVNVGSIQVSVKTDTGFRYVTCLPSGMLPQPLEDPPPEPGREPQEPKLQGCPREIVQTLKEVGHRLTGMQLASEMAKRGFRYSENAVRNAASTMVEMGVLSNSQDANPRGYGLAEWANL